MQTQGTELKTVTGEASILLHLMQYDLIRVNGTSDIPKNFGSAVGKVPVILDNPEKPLELILPVNCEVQS